MFPRSPRDFNDKVVYRMPGLLLEDNPPHVHLNTARPPLNMTSRRSESKKSLNKFQVMLNVKHFRPDEIQVKTIDNFIVVNGKHEEQADEHGFISREFTRRYELPEDVEPHTVTSSWNQDGILTVQAPRKMLQPPPKNERVVPITIQRPASVEVPKQRQQIQVQQSASQNVAEQQ